jgi:phenylacetic acid degradation operon negative regulatory protein
MVVPQVADRVDLPRIQTGANPQHLIITLLGDYWSGRKEHLPSAALVALANEFEITSTSARAALSRLARRNLLDSSRDGRRTFYGLTARAERVLNEGFARIVQFGLDDRPWDGSWSVVIFSVPEDQRDVRHVLRTRLRWLGFAPLYDGAWVSPRANGDDTRALLEELGVASATVFVGHVEHAINGGDPLSAWDLDELRASYEEFVGEFRPLLDRVDEGDVGAAEAMVARTRVMDVWRQFPNLDPELPEDVLPSGWPRRDAQAIFARVYDALGPLAEMRFQQILAEHEPALAKQAHHLTTKATSTPTRRRRLEAEPL